MARIQVRGRIWTSGPGASCAPCPTCLSTAAPPPQTRAAAVRSAPNTPEHQFDETGRALREEEKKRIAVTVKLHMAGLSSIERYVHAQKEQGKQMGRVGDACGDFSVRRLRAVRVELCSGGEASGRCSGLPRPQKLGHGSSGPQSQALSRTSARMLGGSGIRQRGCGTSLPPKALLVVHARKKVRSRPEVNLVRVTTHKDQIWSWSARNLAWRPVFFWPRGKNPGQGDQILAG